ncbi:Pentatricopeptide repeat-containing protein, chloroplastic [Glycine soja]
MMLDSAFSNLYDLMMEPVDVYKIWLPKFTVIPLSLTFSLWMPTPFVVNAHSKEEKKDCFWFSLTQFNGWMEPQHFCIHSSMGEVAVILKGTRDIGAIVGSRVYKLPNEKEVVYGALDKWTAWETEFLVIAMSKALKILRKMGHWVRVIQTVKKLSTSAFLRVCGGLLQAKGQYLGKMRFNFSCKVRIQVIEGFDEMIFEVHKILA